MSIQVREGRFDLVVLAAPGIQRWPGLGVRALATQCSEAGLSVGLFGGEGLKVKGVLPASGTGGVALIEDSQGRIHRIESRAVVRVAERLELPDPFPGWNEPALLPLESALRLRKEGQTVWSPSTVILGTGNRALVLGCDLLESGVPEVHCVDVVPGLSGWEVYRRRFEGLGGRVLRAQPVGLRKKAPLLWELRLKDAIGVRVMEVAWVISAGPFSKSDGIREYPPGSCLFELEQSGGPTVQDDPQGWVLEEERGKLLGVRVIKALGASSERMGSERALRDQMEEVQRRAKLRLKRANRHLDSPMIWSYQGKWTGPALRAEVARFAGVPKSEHSKHPVASIECLEEIECKLCQAACPDNAIQISRSKGTFLNESACTGCGKCISACPAKVPVLIHEPEGRSTAQLTLPLPQQLSVQPKELVGLINRRGEALGSGKVLELSDSEGWIKVDVPSHLAWEARGVRKARRALEDEWVMSAEKTASSKVEVTLQGSKRMLRSGQPLALALFETGLARGDDRLLCRDGSCRRCEIRVDGVKKLACRTQVHRGMAIQLIEKAMEQDSELLCPCSSVRTGEVIAKIRDGKLKTPDSIRQACGVGEGSCRGRTCMGGFKRLLEGEGIECRDWIDWRFPWSDWTLSV